MRTQVKYALNQPSWRRLWGRCELGECLVSESEADGDSARSSVAAVEEGAQRRLLQAVADGDSARGSVAAVEEGAQRRPLQAVVRELEAGWAKVDASGAITGRWKELQVGLHDNDVQLDEHGQELAYFMNLSGTFNDINSLQFILSWHNVFFVDR